MATNITAEMFVAALIKRNVKFRYYRDFADFKNHNRNAQQGWGPIYGTLNHNFASDISDESSARYLYFGDLARGLPGPMVQTMTEDDGTLVLIGWGAANHSGPGDDRFIAKAKANALPLDSDFKPSTNGNSGSAVTSAMNPHFVANEMAYGAKVTPAQYKTTVQFNAVCMELFGGPENGYSGGSVGSHREVTTNRSDPTGVPAYKIRNDVNALLKEWAAPVKPPEGPIVAVDPTKRGAPIENPSTQEIWDWDGIRAFNADDPGQTNDWWGASSVLTWMHRDVVDSKKKIVEIQKDHDETKAALLAMQATLNDVLKAVKPDAVLPDTPV